MKTKFTPLAAILFAASTVLFFSCGSKSEGETKGNDSTKTVDSSSMKQTSVASFADACKSENAITMTIKMFEAKMKPKFSYETPAFEVKQSTFVMNNDSSAEMTLMNYTADELKGEKNDKQIDIIVTFYSKNGKKIGPGVYTYLMDKGDYTASAKMSTAKGSAYFNWAMGMPDPGNITLNFASATGACGTFNLAVDDPKSDMIGTVKLGGSFKVGN